jgi:3'-phosphoadenosine 5'-phosphosulfate sulfotransferase (PAPS reductase)/FAD synthetase
VAVQIGLPPQVREGEYLCIMSMSGGKDSTACALALREAEVDFRMVFADTGWEAAETYEHLDHLRNRLGPIDVVQSEAGGMVAIARRKAGFPMRQGRWCTKDLKVYPLRKYHDKVSEETGRDTVSVVGIRAAESDVRALMPEWEDAESWGGFVWRPILEWSVEDVLAIHHRHGVEVNPLYKRGHSRVGCFPCIFANKEEIRLIAQHAPDRIDLIRALESELTAERARRNASGEGTFAWPDATFFMSKHRGSGVMAIDRAVEWSQTSHGGRQLPMFDADPTGGCFRWGMCEPPEGA